MTRVTYIFYFLFFSGLAVAQPKIIWSENQSPLIPKFEKEILETPNDSSYAENIKALFENNGFLESNVLFDSAMIIVDLGNQYFFGAIKSGNIPKGTIQKLNLGSKFFEKKPFSPVLFNKSKEKIITYFENSGYPFASVKLDTTNLINYTILGSWQLNKGPLITIDSLEIISEETLPKNYIGNYIGFIKKQPYNEELISEISTRIKEIPFALETKPASVIFGEDHTTLRLNLKKQKASSFNGVAGFLPDENTGKILITGDLKLALQNALQSGEIIKLNWRKMQTNTQDINGYLNYNFLFNTPLGLEADARLYRRDTTFAEQNLKLGLQYAISRGNFFKLILENYNSNLISTNQYEDFTTLPPFADVRKRNYGICLSAMKLNYKFNPRSGYSYNIEIKGGTRRILENNNLNATIYDSLKLHSNQYQLTGNLDFFIPIMKRSTIKLANNSGWMINDELFVNELTRIGGLNTFRGFDEEVFSVSAFSVFTAEYRLLLEENSFYYVFFDGGFWEQNLKSNYDRDTPFGFGTGISFETKAGIFTVNYALGKQRNNPLDLRSAKIHFGFLSLF